METEQIATIQRLERENGSLAGMYALCEQTLRERTERLNVVEAENQRLTAKIQAITNDSGVLTEALNEAADLWHARDCIVDAGGGCILHADEKQAWVAERIANNSWSP